MSAWTIRLDFPSPSLFPNRTKGKHWGALHAAKTQAKELAFFLTKQQTQGWTPTTEDLRLTVTFLMPDRRKRDADNCLAAAKSTLDGMALALGVDDFQFQPVQVYRRFGVKPGSMIVEIDDGKDDRPE